MSWFSVIIPVEMLIKPSQGENCPCARFGDDMSRQGLWEESAGEKRSAFHSSYSCKEMGIGRICEISRGKHRI